MNGMIPDEELPPEAQALLRFIRATIRNQKADPEATAAALGLCKERLQSLTVTKFKGSGRAKRKLPRLDSPEFVIACKRVRGEITKTQARQEIATIRECSESTAAEYLSGMETKAEPFLDFFDLDDPS